MRYVRFAFVFLVFCLLCVPSALHLYGLIAWDVLLGTARQKHRHRVGRWRSWWGALTWKVVVWGFGLDVEFKIDRRGDRGQPLILVANHRTLLDILVMVELARRLGRPDLRWVLKKPLRYAALFIGRSCVETECAFVARGGHETDLAEIERCALTARTDEASVAIFPEGTRFRPKKGSPYKTLLRPHARGFEVLRRELPRHDVLAVTLHWHGGAETATTLFQNASSVNAKLVVETRLAGVRDDPAGWLETEWRLKDRKLSGEPTPVPPPLPPAPGSTPPPSTPLP
jgi:1-acyl-sn-glycerol-3-phosphate acyltransferase